MQNSIPTSTRLAITSLKETFARFSGVLTRAWIPLVVLHLISCAADQMTTFSENAIQAQGKEDLSAIVLLVLAQIIFNVIWSALWTLQLAAATYSTLENRPMEPTQALYKKYLDPVMIETVRSLASVTYRTMLLLIPGLIEYLRLAFVPFVVMFDPTYQRGETDALEKSRALTKGRWLLLLAVLALAVAVPGFFESMAQGDNSYFWQSPWRFSISALVTFFINLGFGIFLVALFRQIFKIGPHADLLS